VHPRAPRVAGYPLTQRRLGGHTAKACRCGGLFRQHISWIETALLGRFQPQTQQTGFASRKFSLLVKELALCFPLSLSLPFLLLAIVVQKVVARKEVGLGGPHHQRPRRAILLFPGILLGFRRTLPFLSSSRRERLARDSTD
jgi:hypothetical protein